MSDLRDMPAEEFVRYALSGDWFFGYKQDKETLKAELLRRLGASGVPKVIGKAKDFLIATGKFEQFDRNATYAVTGLQLIRLLNEFVAQLNIPAGASGVDVEGLAKEITQVSYRRNHYEGRDLTEGDVIAAARKHIAQPSMCCSICPHRAGCILAGRCKFDGHEVKAGHIAQPAALVVGEPCPTCRSKYLGEMEPGDYSCASCGMGMIEPCEHWKNMQAAEPAPSEAEQEESK